MTATRRQLLADLLVMGHWTFAQLRQEMGVTVAVLADDLRHVERSVVHRGQKLETTPASCTGCGFRFRPKAGRFTTPKRCPQCRNENLEPMQLTLR